MSTFCCAIGGLVLLVALLFLYDFVLIVSNATAIWWVSRKVEKLLRAEGMWEEFVAIRRERLKDKNDPWFDRSVPTCKLHMPSLWSSIRVSFQDYFSWNDD